MSTLLDWSIYVEIRVFLTLLGILPRTFSYPLCAGLATLVFWLDKKHRCIGMVNLEIAFPEKDLEWRQRILRKSFQEIGHHVAELSRFQRLSRDNVLNRITYEEDRGLENYLKVKDEEGILFMTAHISIWEILPSVHALNGHPLYFLVRPLDNPFVEKWMNQLRCCYGNRVISKQGSVRHVLKVLKEGHDVGFLMDQNIQEREGVYVPLFGRPACTSSALASLALRTSAPVVAGFIYPSTTRGHYVIRFYPPFRLRSSGNPDKDLSESTALLNSYIEDIIREYPHCWLWCHRRFHTQPDGSNPYEKC